MKKTYRILSLLLALIMVFSLLTGCWGDDEDEEEDEEEEEETEETSEDEEEEDEEDEDEENGGKKPVKPQPTQPETTAPTVPETTAPTVPETVPPTVPETVPPTIPEETVPPTTPEETVPDPLPPDQDGQVQEVTLGHWEDKKYINEYCGLSVTLDRLWVPTKAEDAGITNDDLPDLMRGYYSSIVDMTATNVKMKMLMVIYQSPYYVDEPEDKSPEGLVDHLIENQNDYTGSLEAVGLKVSSVEKVEATFLGETRTVAKITGTMGGVPIYIAAAVDYFGGEVPVLVCGATLGRDSCVDTLALYEPLGEK